MSTYTIAEIGSTHMGKEDYVKASIEAASEAGFSAVKFQLFPNKEEYTHTGNVHMSGHLFEIAYKFANEWGIDCSASVFGENEFQFLKQFVPPFIKLAYSKQKNRSWIEECIDASIDAIVSCDFMTIDAVPNRATKLYCVPQYPVVYELAFDGVFPKFDGFSDHTIGFRQTSIAVEEGAKVIEKHVSIQRKDIKCPDYRFAATFADAKNFHAQLKNLERKRDGESSSVRI